MAGLTAVPRIRALACGNYSTGVIGSDDTAYLLGRWDGISEKTAVVRCLSTLKTPLPCPIPDSHPRVHRGARVGQLARLQVASTDPDVGQRSQCTSR